MRSSPPNPTELVIRDYLYRLSTAARGRLGVEERRALEARTRQFIERSTEQLGASNSMQIAALLSRLDDPAVLVEQEVARLAAEHGDTGPAAQPGGRLRRRSGRANWQWAPPGDGLDPDTLQLDDDAGVGPGEDVDDFREPPIWVPRQPPVQEMATIDDQHEAMTVTRPRWPHDIFSNSVRQPSPAPVAAAVPGAEIQEYRRGSRAAAAVLAEAREHKLEAIAATVMGLGGVLYPPVWLLGAVLAIWSRVWDFRDKWLGLAGPVVVLVGGTMAGLILGGHHVTLSAYVHKGWILADVLSRLGAVVGAYYLAWRVGHPRQEPDVPPWNRPRKIG